MQNSNEAMREALEYAIARAEEARAYLLRSADTKACMEELINKCRAALALPRRNCDVGTAEEQTARYDKFCNTNRTVEKCCTDCPALGTADCELLWAQIPYNESEATDGK